MIFYIVHSRGRDTPRAFVLYLAQEKVELTTKDRERKLGNDRLIFFFMQRKPMNKNNFCVAFKRGDTRKKSDYLKLIHSNFDGQ